MNHTEPIPSTMDMDPLSYEYPYEGYTQTYPYPNKLQQSIYQAYQQTSANYTRPEPTLNPLPTPQTSVVQEPPKYEDKTVKPVAKRKKKEKKQKSTYCSEKITDTEFKFYGCAVCNVSYNALHELDQHVTVHKNRMTSYRLRLRNQIKKKQIKKEKKKLKKMIKIKKENEFEVEIKPEDGYIGEEKASDFVNNEINNSECNGNGGLTLPEQQNSEINSDKGNSVNNGSQSHETSLPNGMSRVNSEIDNGNNTNSKDTMDEAELNNLEKIYKCFACQKQFTLSYYLKLHVRSHTDEKPYSCAACGQAFITASKLGRHNKRIHLAERYQCRVCFKIYSRFEQLTAHFDKTHPEDKLEGEPYDYNAILPYLKELEEQLRAAPEDSKPKVEDLFWEEQVGPQLVAEPPGGEAPADIKIEAHDEDQKVFVPKLDITIEEVKVDFDLDIKREVSDDEGGAGDGGGAEGGDGGDGGASGGDEGANEGAADVKGEDSTSDEDYFPSNTWAAPPSPPPPPGGGVKGGRSPSARKRAGATTCDICHKVVSSASYMRVHMRTHTGEKPFKCYQCGRGFITSSKMHRHVLTHAQDKDSIKTEGEDTKPDVDELSGEHEEGDGDTKPAKKKSKMKSKASKLKNGESKPRRKHQKRPHACEYCNQKFLHINMLEVHKQSHAGEALVLRCHYCLREQPDAAALQAHQAEHTGAKPYLCTICGKTYKKRETMVYHRKRHAPDKEFVCDICSKRFNAACKLRKHMHTHRAERFVLRYECPVCAHMFHTKYHVHMHLRTHTREGLIPEHQRAQVLAMVLQNARKLPRGAEHALVEPRDERSRVCNICGEVFQHFYYLEEHLKSHGARISVAEPPAEDKKYVCPVCSKGFKLHYYLKLHSFTHSKEKPFICQQCGKGFITKGKLKRHLETHSGLKKYQCHICYKFFTRPSYLRIHIRTIHGTQDYNFRFDSCYGPSLPSALCPLPSAASDGSQNSV